MFYTPQNSSNNCSNFSTYKPGSITCRCKSMGDLSLFRVARQTSNTALAACECDDLLSASSETTSSVDDSSVFSNFCELPPPEPFLRPRMQSSAGAYSRRVASASVSLTAPHFLLSVSKPLCELLGYGEEELSGRTIRILQGPKSNPMALTSAIKCAALSTCRTERTVICDKAGKEHEATISCSPFLGADGMLAGCKMDIAFFDGECTPARRHSQMSNYRARYNFITGMMLQQAFKRHESCPYAC